MAVFVVVSLKDSAEKIGEIVLEKIGEANSYALRDDAWLVESDGTAQSLAVELGIRGGESGTGIVFSISNFSGRASPDVWEWLKPRFARRGV